MQVAGLFAGIGGFEAGLKAAGHSATLLCEVSSSAKAVLKKRFPTVPLEGDVRDLRSLPSSVELLTAGFPCQDLSQAGLTRGLDGKNSGLVSEVFRLLERSKPEWVLLENVPFMLHLSRGAAMRHIISELDRLKYNWSWRVVDTYGFALPQRRQRVFLLASKSHDPADVLLVDDHPIIRPVANIRKRAHGFYWTEGRLGLGWAVDAVPTLKNGSAIGIPSPPAILLPDGSIIKPDIRDAERLQGFRSDWTKPAETVGRASLRWSLVGSAVSVPVARWLGDRLARPGSYDVSRDCSWDEGGSLPSAARSLNGRRFRVDISTDPLGRRPKSLVSFLSHPGTPLSYRAASSFLERTKVSGLRFQPGFIEAVESYVRSSSQGDRLAA